MTRSISTGIHVFTDGACAPNPGPGAWALVVFVDGKQTHTSTGAALPVNLYSDSQYSVNGCNTWRHGWMRRGWRRKGGAVINADLRQALDAELSERPQAVTWVKGHSSIPGNVRADRLAGAVLANLKRTSWRAA